METERKHAILSASSAKKWLNCTPSARLEATLPEKVSQAAEEGTLAHEICELKLRKLFIEQAMTDRVFKTKLNKLKKKELYNPEMEKYTDSYVDYISQIAYSYPTTPYITAEKKVDYSDYAPEGFGTADCIIIHKKECHVCDFKYGKGVKVSAEGNPQLGLYALGVLKNYSCIYPIEKVILHIIQPRLNNFSQWETSTEELKDWGELFVKPKAALAFKGEGKFNPGMHCDDCFCNAGGICRARSEHFLQIARDNADSETGQLKQPALLDNIEIGAILSKAQNIAAWVKKLEKHALEEVLSGRDVPGWKAVEGRSNRELSNTSAALSELMEAGYNEAVLYDKKPVSLTQLETLVTSDDFAILEKYIIKPQGKPTLVPETDKRPVFQVNSLEKAQKEFSGSDL